VHEIPVADYVKITGFTVEGGTFIRDIDYRGIA
jgi:hypothetical protein